MPDPTYRDAARVSCELLRAYYRADDLERRESGMPLATYLGRDETWAHVIAGRAGGLLAHMTDPIAARQLLVELGAMAIAALVAQDLVEQARIDTGDELEAA